MTCSPLADAVTLLKVDAETRWGHIIDCTPEVHRHRSFVERHGLHARVQAFVEAHSSGYRLLTGGPGLGKSAFVSTQVRQGPQPVVPHFIKRGMGN